jgi:hypothetical protein
MGQPLPQTPEAAGAVAAPIRIRLSRAKGWRLPENTTVVSRPSKWGNPFIVGKDGKREDCARWFAFMLNGSYLCGGTPTFDEMRAYRRFASRNLSRLKGKNLACWCALPKPGEPDHCHAAVLLHVANRP